MRRILAIVCIFILLLITGMPMFTSNLLCNETRVYADSVPDQLYTDREKVIAAMTVYFNDHKGVLKVLNNGQEVNAAQYATTVYDMYISHFITYYRYEQSTIKTLADIAGYIDVTNDPFIVRMYSPAVGFFNAFLQWMMEKNGITNSPTGSDGLYDGYHYNNVLFYTVNNFDKTNTYDTAELQSNKVQVGMPAGNLTPEQLYTLWRNTGNNSSYDFSYFGKQDISTTSYSLQLTFTSSYTFNGSIGVTNQYNANDGRQFFSPRLTAFTSFNSQGIYPFIGGTVYSIREKKCYGNFAYLRIIPTSNTPYYACGYVVYNSTDNVYYITKFHDFTNNESNGIGNANINFDKDGYDSNPTSEPGSDGLEYEPKQTGTGNTYNNYNNYYNDYHEGDTYVTHPGSGGGGSGGGGSGGDDPGSGEDPTPGGTTPPWDGTQDPGTPAGTLTPGSDGYYFNLPDIGLPDLNIDWSINGLKEKFPFSIPWDLMAFFAVMNAEPETPYIKADIPLGLWEWNIDWDLHAFDNVARILRNMELIGFCIGLILITRSIIKG